MSGREQAETGFPQRFSSAGSLLGDKTRGGGRTPLERVTTVGEGWFQRWSSSSNKK